MSVLPAGTTTAQAKLIQRALNEKTSSNLVIDGNLGPASVACLDSFQSASGLPVSGCYDTATAAILDPFIAQKYLSASSYSEAAGLLGTDAATVQTVCQVETSGAGFFNNGQCTILFERSQFYKAMKAVTPAAELSQLVASYPNIINPVGGGYLGGEAEWGRLQQAQTLNSDLALRSASWGLFQIMGYYYVQCGYQSAEAFTTAMQTSETLQLDAFVEFVKDENGGSMLTALTSHNWVSFAEQYNGSNEHAQNDYDDKLARAYSALV
ncbi:N-acetylmuramidase domain-containing protein [Paraburkholderia sp. BCC1886]|uniref:N-acetylmuramidase domain-containing protein n=1 Tax=Paraburkholderia sp. BCC1886 TaxID=2562670 RepID=UPI001183CFC5|nr:N-acetylmuramidase domain-containing protein [Paraburkholderia sp. BCC1886]